MTAELELTRTQPAVDMGSMEEPDGYSDLTPEQAKVADDCWHKGMDNLECAVLNWAFDELGMSCQRQPFKAHALLTA